jgi:hypothetical protein
MDIKQAIMNIINNFAGALAAVIVLAGAIAKISAGRAPDASNTAGAARWKSF